MNLAVPIAPARTASLLEVEDLAVTISTEHGPAAAVRGVSLAVGAGEFLALVGESGSGKSLTFLAVMGLLPKIVPCRIEGAVRFAGRSLIDAPPETLRRLRGREMSLVFQDPLSALNPVLRIGDQIAQVIRTHEPGIGRTDAARRAVEVLERVRIPAAAARARDYPYQFSGGMRQRVLIAMAIACRPKLLIADEPTTALDVTVQAQILELLDGLRRELGMGLVLITHDLGLVARHAERVAVMYAGRIVEEAPVARLFGRPAHPYTAALIAAAPRLGAPSARLAALPGEPPGIGIGDAGCAFLARCVRAHGRARCADERPILRPVASAQRAACHFAEERETVASPSPVAAKPTTASVPLVAIEGLAKTFRARGRGGKTLHALADVSLAIERGRTLGVVGESGSGKSTMARCLLRLVEPSAGRIVFDGQDITALGSRALRPIRDRMQVMFQDPRASLDPRMSVEAIVGEPLAIRGLWKRGGRDRVRTTLRRVGLSPAHAARYPHEFSGGQQQRIGLARALILEPDLLVLDEPVSSLDVSIRAQILNLLKDLQAELGLTYLFIGHDLAVMHHISDRIAVMYLGRVVEEGPADALCRAPIHPYTRALIASAPEPDPDSRAASAVEVRGEPADPLDPPPGCPYHPRCRRAEEAAATGIETIAVGARRLPLACATQRPPLALMQPAHQAACHFPALH